MTAHIPLGVSDFRRLREQGLVYVDKSHMIREILDKGAQTILLPRPRRFGKTLNLTMLRCFFEKREEDLSGLFADLSIMQAGSAYRAHFQRHPVVFVSFKDVKARTWEDAWATIVDKLASLVDEHRYLLSSDRLSAREIEQLAMIVDGKAATEGYQGALRVLTRCLATHHGQEVVVLVDEYDEPIHAGWTNGYGAQVLDFFRAFMNAGLKDNPYVFKAVITGILRVAKESIFSGLNNPAVYTLLARDFSTCFGFTEPEVARLLSRVGLSSHLDAARLWYNGYVFGGTVIYNPWSILSFIDRGEERPRAYWVATSSNDLVRDMLVRHALAVEPDIGVLLEGGEIEQPVDEGVVLEELSRRPDVLFSLLLFSGYLKAEEVEVPHGEPPRYLLSIPNREVRQVYTSTFQAWMRERLGGLPIDVERLTRSILGGDEEGVTSALQAFTENMLSYHDTALRPEQVYHAFVIGLLATLAPAYDVRSNRESGRGRPDVMIAPRGGTGPGVVMELKVAKRGKQAMAKALAEGALQIHEGAYRAELSARGLSPVHAFVVAFDGKKVAVRSVPEAAAKRPSAQAKKPVKRKAPPRKGPTARRP